MQLSDWFIFLGSLFFLIGVVSILSDRRSRIKAKGEKTLNGRIEFFKSKWQREHAVAAALPALLVITLSVLSVVMELPILTILAGVVFLTAYLILRNQMMIYVEANAFETPEGSGRRIHGVCKTDTAKNAKASC